MRNQNSDLKSQLETKKQQIITITKHKNTKETETINKKDELQTKETKVIKLKPKDKIKYWKSVHDEVQDLTKFYKQIIEDDQNDKIFDNLDIPIEKESASGYKNVIENYLGKSKKYGH